MTVTLENQDGEQVEVEVGYAEKIKCPECGSENFEFHSLTRVLAGECATCFHTWTIGLTNEWDVVEENND